MLAALMSLFGVVGSLGGKLIEDKDKKTEFAFKTLELSEKAMEAILNTKTYPWIDGIVKLMYGLKELIIPMFRPLGSIAMAVFGAYCVTHNVHLPDALSTALFGAPLAWGVSRHVEKKAKAVVKDDSDEMW